MQGDRSLQIMLRAARRAGAIVRRHYLSDSLEVEKKTSAGDLVSIADLEAEKEILSIIRRAFPDASIVAEESGGSHESGMAFYVDPLDGTLNFVHGIPFFNVSIGCWTEGEAAAGVVLNPMSGDTYTAVRGAGARKNGRLITVSASSSLKDSLIATGWPYDSTDRAGVFAEMDRVYMKSQALRALGCASQAFCLVAEGALDGFWEMNLKPWDMAAGALIVTEAGGTITSASGGPLDLGSGRIAASNGRIHAELLDVLGTRGA
jgi:myo-inositol-1(or 4)-monophosphatase